MPYIKCKICGEKTKYKISDIFVDSEVLCWDCDLKNIKKAENIMRKYANFDNEPKSEIPKKRDYIGQLIMDI